MFSNHLVVLNLDDYVVEPKNSETINEYNSLIINHAIVFHDVKGYKMTGTIICILWSYSMICLTL